MTDTEWLIQLLRFMVLYNTLNFEAVSAQELFSKNDIGTQFQIYLRALFLTQNFV